VLPLTTKTKSCVMTQGSYITSSHKVSTSYCHTAHKQDLTYWETFRHEKSAPFSLCHANNLYAPAVRAGMRCTALVQSSAMAP
jgi:hypothetical protein